MSFLMVYNTRRAPTGHVLKDKPYNKKIQYMGQLFSRQAANASSAASSSSASHNTFDDIINDIATNYILTMNFATMVDLKDKAYCDRIVVLTSDALKKNFTEMQIQYLEQKLNGADPSAQPTDEETTQNLIFYDKETVDDANTPTNKARMCDGIARYYVKVAHIFAAIMTTINPVYVYKDPQTGEQVLKSLAQKMTIPPGVEFKTYKINICDNRINDLNNTAPILDASGADITPAGAVNMVPGMCDANAIMPETLADEPGIPELEQLYYDDKYDFDTGEFTAMSPQSRAQYDLDLRTFYTAFVGIAPMPATIQRFSDIKLRTYSTTAACEKTGDGVTIDKGNPLYVAYAKNIADMMNKAATQQRKLLEVINMLFIQKTTPEGTRIIRISPTLTHETLQKAVVLARSIIVQLYVGCEQSYVEGIKLYEAIVESQVLNTTQNQINSLTEQANSLISPFVSVPASESPAEAEAEAEAEAAVENSGYTPMSAPMSVPMAPAPSIASAPVSQNAMAEALARALAPMQSPNAVPPPQQAPFGASAPIPNFVPVSMPMPVVSSSPVYNTPRPLNLGDITIKNTTPLAVAP